MAFIVWRSNCGRSFCSDSVAVKLTTTFSPSVSTSISPRAMASSSARTISSAASLSPPSSSFFFWFRSRSGCAVLVVCCVISVEIDGFGDGLKFSDRIVVPLGCSTIGTTRCTPKAFFSDPEICLNFGTLNSANDRIRTKNAIRSVAMSAKVAIQAGAPTGGHFLHSGQPSSNSATSSSSSPSISVASAIAHSPQNQCPVFRPMPRPVSPAVSAAGWTA